MKQTFVNRKKILIVCRYFYPEITPRAFRASELAKELALQGHEVFVLTPKKEIHAVFEKQNNLIIIDLGQLKWRVPDFGHKGIGYVLTRMAVRFLQLSIEYPAIELLFKVRKSLKKLNGFDLLISIAVPYPIHWGVATTWSKSRKPAKKWIADCGDPYMGDRTDSFRKWFYFKYIEKWFMKKADFISITKDSFKVNYYKEFHSKIIEIPQGFRFDNIALSEYKPNKIPHFAFAGGFIKDIRDPRKFLEYLTTLNDVEFKFYIYTKSKEFIVPYRERLKDKLILMDYIPRAELITNISIMDFLVNFEFDPKIQSPSKLIDYAIAKRPILNITNEKFDVTTINQFLSGDYTNQFIVENINQYRIENVADKFLKLCE